VCSNDDTSAYVLLYCPTCKCLIHPPFDGYVTTDYPREWEQMAGDRPQLTTDR